MTYFVCVFRNKIGHWILMRLNISDIQEGVTLITWDTTRTGNGYTLRLTGNSYGFLQTNKKH